MTGHFNAIPANLRASAERVRGVSHGVTVASQKLDLSGITSGMPGSSSARLASHAVEAWNKELTTLGQDIDSYANALEDAAKGYESTDSQSAARLRQAGGKS